MAQKQSQPSLTILKPALQPPVNLLGGKSQVMTLYKLADIMLYPTHLCTNCYVFSLL